MKITCFFSKGNHLFIKPWAPFGVQKKHRLSKSFRETREAVFFPESQQTFFWGPGQFGRYMDVSLNGGCSPQIIHFNRVFHYKAIHFGVPLFLETPIWTAGCLLYFFGTFPRSIHPWWISRTAQTRRLGRLVDVSTRKSNNCFVSKISEAPKNHSCW